MTSRITFTPGNHSYRYVGDDGRKQPVPSVTTLLNALAKPALVRWAARVASEYATDNWQELSLKPPSERARLIMDAPNRARDTAAAKGTQIHAWAEQLLAGEPVEIPEQHSETVKRFADWWVLSGFVAEHTELVVWSDDDDLAGCRYAGKFDCLAIHPKYGWTLVDFKSGSGVWPEAAIQLAGYALADHIVIGGEDAPMPRIDTLAAVHIRPDGTTLHVVPKDQRRVAEEVWGLVRALRTTGVPEFQQEAS